MVTLEKHAIDSTERSPLKVAMLLFPGLTLLDLAGPEGALGPHSQIHLVWKSMEPVPSDTGVRILPSCTFEECPSDLDVLFVPGGLGTADAMEDPAVLAFLRDRGARARYVTSVCSGSLILAAAGLLQGYQATTHWTSLDILSLFGVEAVERRVVVDRNRISGGGVTAGIDFGLRLLAELRGEDVAKLTQLALEYDPQPPFNAGSPREAGPILTEMALGIVAEVRSRTRAIAERERGVVAPVG
jgi:cyclohexyl-isocyanide hydratase